MNMSSGPIRPLEGSPTWEETYRRIAEELRRLLEAVTDDESAGSFVEPAVAKLKTTEATTPEFFPGNFYDGFRQAILDEVKAEVASGTREMTDITSASKVVSEDLNARLDVARETGDRHAAHTLWKECAQKKAEIQAAVDARAERTGQWVSRLTAVDNLGFALGGSRRATPPPAQFGQSREPVSTKLKCREAVLEAMRTLERRHGRQVFGLGEIVQEVLSHHSFKESTVRTHVTSRMCSNAPDHHGTVYSDLVRVGHGLYRMR